MIAPPGRSTIAVRGARQNNLRAIDVDFPRGAWTVVTGVSGSGKSSLALDTLYAEGQRRYVSSLSTYAQQFLERLPRPDVDAISGLPPAIAIEPSNPTVNRRSTVGTATEVYDFLRLLYARTGTLMCPNCDLAVAPVSPTAAADQLLAETDGSAWYVTFELPISGALTHDALVDNLRALGFLRVLVDGAERHLEDADDEDWIRAAPLHIVVDRVIVGRTPRSRVVEAVERAYTEGGGEVVLFPRGAPAAESLRRISRHARCDGCGRSFPSIRPSMFSFNNPYGACPGCGGFGNVLEFDIARIVPEADVSLAGGAIHPWVAPRYGGWRDRVAAFATQTDLDPDVAWRDLPADGRRVLVEGGTFHGVRFRGAIPFLEGLVRKKYRPYIRFFLRRYQSRRRCCECNGTRLRADASWVRLGGISLPELVGRGLPDVASWLTTLEFPEAARPIARPILGELERRLDLLEAVGLEYLTLDRLTRTLSGGEAQRIAIANALGSSLTGGLYVLDEPTVGLHARDTGRIVRLLRELVESGNTVVAIEHDLGVVGSADHVIELGPGSGSDGGRVVFEGPPSDLAAADTVTGGWLSGARTLPPPRGHRVDGPHLVVRGARGNNLRGIDVTIPVRALTVVTGVSGSGKSTFVHDVLYRAVANALGEVPVGDRDAGRWDAMEGAAWLAGITRIDQSPIGKSPRSNPVTYVKAFDPIRRLFAATPDARRRGFGPGHFSFNTADGRCAECGGDGHQRIEMHFLPDVFVTCGVCRGRRYRDAVLKVRWRGRTIADVLALTVDEAIAGLAGEPAAGRRLRVLQSVGLGYLTLGQPATTLSGGESQRLKIAREIAAQPALRKGRTRARGALVIMDEPTVGLHNEDVRALVRVIDDLIGRGNTVVVVEHHAELIERADWLVDLGPEGGPGGGDLVVEGTVEAVANCERSHTGSMLRERSMKREAIAV